MTLCTIIPELIEKGLFHEWIGLEKDEEQWNNNINGFFNKSWQEDEEDEETEEPIKEEEVRAKEMEERDNVKKDNTDVDR